MIMLNLLPRETGLLYVRHWSHRQHSKIYLFSTSSRKMYHHILQDDQTTSEMLFFNAVNTNSIALSQASLQREFHTTDISLSLNDIDSTSYRIRIWAGHSWTDARNCSQEAKQPVAHQVGHACLQYACILIICTHHKRITLN